MASEAERQVLRANLMPFEAYARFIRDTTGRKILGLQRDLPRFPCREHYMNKARRKVLTDASIRIGKQHRFRPSLRSLELLTGRPNDHGRPEGNERSQPIPSVVEID